MRKDAPEPERRLWAHLRASQTGYRFRRQEVIEPFIVDFLCPFNGVIVEVDGDTHRSEVDQKRDNVLTKRCFTAVRFTNAQVMTKIEGVIEHIMASAAELPERRKIAHPNPSLGREGQ